jgi:hypothetical protein
MKLIQYGTLTRAIGALICYRLGLIFEMQEGFSERVFVRPYEDAHGVFEDAHECSRRS